MQRKNGLKATAKGFYQLTPRSGRNWRGSSQLEQTQGGAASSVSSVALRLPGGVQIELADPKQVPLVAALLRALAQPC